MSDSDFVLLNQKSMLFETVKLLVSKNRILESTKSSNKILATGWEEQAPLSPLSLDSSLNTQGHQLHREKTGT